MALVPIDRSVTHIDLQILGRYYLFLSQCKDHDQDDHGHDPDEVHDLIHEEFWFSEKITASDSSLIYV